MTYKPRKPYQTGGQDRVCPLVRVQFMGFENGTHRALGNRSMSLMVPEAKVSEVFELVAQALAGMLEVDKQGSGC